MSTVKWMVSGPVDLAHTQKPPVPHSHLNELLDAWPPDVGRSGCCCDTPGSSSKPPSSSHLLSLGAPASSLLLSQTGSDTQFGDRSPALLAGALITECLLRNEYLVQLIIMQLK